MRYAVLALALLSYGCAPEQEQRIGTIARALANGAAAMNGDSLYQPNSGPVCDKIGESISGLNKTCMYNCVGSPGATTIGVTDLCPLAVNENTIRQRPAARGVVRTTCFKRGEFAAAFNKVCTYDCAGSEVAITIGSTQLCQLTIQQ